MAAPRTQKRASANAGRTTAKRGSASRASSSRSGRSRASTRSAAPSRSRRGSSRHPLAAIVIVGAIIAAAWSIYPVFRLQYEHQREVRTLEAELESLKERNGELRSEVDELKTPEGVEEVARETLGLVKPGEEAYVVTGGTIGETSSTAQPAEERDTPVWQGVLDTLFGLE